MGRDYKKSSASRRRTKKSPSPVRFLLGGFALGVVAAAIVYYALAPAPVREPDRPVPGAVRPPPSIDDEEPVARVSSPDKDDLEPVEPAKDRYDFYDVLPNFEVIVPEAAERVEQTSPLAEVKKPGAYVLQVGSFRRFTDADGVKARLALQGIESNIQRVTIDDKTYHRVRIGPETQLIKVNRLRTRLREQNMDALLIRVAE